MKATKKPVTIECFKYDGDLKNSNGEYYHVHKAYFAEYQKKYKARKAA